MPLASLMHARKSLTKIKHSICYNEWQGVLRSGLHLDCEGKCPSSFHTHLCDRQHKWRCVPHSHVNLHVCFQCLSLWCKHSFRMAKHKRVYWNNKLTRLGDGTPVKCMDWLKMVWTGIGSARKQRLVVNWIPYGNLFLFTVSVIKHQCRGKMNLLFGKPFRNVPYQKQQMEAAVHRSSMQVICVLHGCKWKISLIMNYPWGLLPTV